MAARCVVETGTATYYRALEQASDEPVLRDLTRRIANDEVRHYKHFFAISTRCTSTSGSAAARYWRAGRRLLEIKNEDAEIALRNVLRIEHEREDVPEAMSGAEFALQRRYPASSAAGNDGQDAVAPLHLNARVERFLRRPIVAVVSRVMLY
jgi:hypothetical protein